MGTKSSKVRGRMERTLVSNLDAMLGSRGIDAEVERRWSRPLIRVRNPEQVGAAAAAAADTFGVVSARPAVTCEPTRERLLDVLTSLTAEHEPEESFAVRVSRAGPKDAHDFGSRELERVGGGVVENRTGASVDLDNPDVTYHVEAREGEAFVSTAERAGPGGLPLGTQGTAVALVSGGIDSPVAAWEVMKRGCVVAPVYVDLGDFGGPDHEARAVSTMRRLADFAPGFDVRPRVVSAGGLVSELAEEVGATRMLSLRRMMLRIGEAVAREIDAHAVVTGESLGQKSSQTGPNFAVTDAVTSLPVYRPLLTRDKPDIVAQARKIGTYDDSTLPVGCERVAPSRPETNAALEDVVDAEPEKLLRRAEKAARAARIVDID
ncbi:tRNA sulfurtransferase [Haloprofundus marisrubri]|uniref:Probable tRNA sulfurtransferase n=2 Tax=Haloprofundus marisrubri TaxID=1514971 RepID=A0A0W1RD00_9EURY|nr:tRNA sulfurtransferase [Haloprofundus marisrubri]KTG11310.1 tRNA sulfurtransferase [Haloprofundus marisrubri]